jgi:DNA-directed RNA polymerase subunit omega
MARVTVEDCLKVVPNRFELIVLVSQRAQAILSGSKPLVDNDDKEIVLALREIAENKIDPNVLYTAIVQKYIHNDNNIKQASQFSMTSFFGMKDFEQETNDMGLGAPAGLEIDGSMFADQNLEVDD